MSDENTTDRNAEREQLLAALDAADTAAGEEPQESGNLAPDNQSDEEQVAAPEQEAEAQEVEAEAPEQTSDAETDEKPLTNREKKSNERLDRNWDKLNEEKAALKKEREELEALKQQHQDDQTSPDDYRELAERYKEDGETELAELALEKAKEVEARKIANEQSKVAESIQSDWTENLKDLQEQYPELKDSSSEMARGVENILDQRPHLRAYSEGIQDAVEFVVSKIAAKKVESLQKENGDLKAQVDELTKQTSVTGAPPGRESTPKNFDDMSQAQKREKLVDALRNADEQQAGMAVFR